MKLTEDLATDLGRHVLLSALESGEIEDNTDWVPWSWTGWTIDSLRIAESSGVVEVQGHQMVEVPEQGTQRVSVVAYCDFSEDALAGDCQVTLDKTRELS